MAEKTVSELVPVVQVQLINDRPATTSLAIAEHFGKPHDRVLKDIRRVMQDCPPDFSLVNFDETSYINEQNGQTYPMFNVFQDGFMVVVMGYPVRKASAKRQNTGTHIRCHHGFQCPYRLHDFHIRVFQGVKFEFYSERCGPVSLPSLAAVQGGHGSHIRNRLRHTASHWDFIADTFSLKR